MRKQPLQITILSGGPSAERSVSQETGAAVARALKHIGHKVRMLDPQRGPLAELHSEPTDLVFNALHGTYGEDGVIQGYLEWLGIPYTGSGVKASAIAMDKAMSRSIFEANDLPIAGGRVWRVGDPLPSLESLPPSPWIVKPTNEGSSVGLDRCYDQETLNQVLMSKGPGAPFDWLIESMVSGVEVSVVVFNGEAWGSVEISPKSGIYDFEAKYVRNDTEYFCPPRLSPSTINRLEQYAVKAYQSLDCEGVCRVDFITDERSDIVLELNTLPGMTATSLVPKVAEARGIAFEDLMQLIIEDALENHMTTERDQ